jgi:DNA-binding transcriptional regulator of glucitol operon
VRKLWTPGWVFVHASVLVLVCGFLALAWWQINRAAQGNALSFGYAVEWPAFAAFVVFVWVVEMRKAVRAETDDTAVPPEFLPTDADSVPVAAAETKPAVRARPLRKRNEAAYDDSADPDLAAYNHYLAWLNTHPNANPAQYPGMKDSTTT